MFFFKWTLMALTQRPLEIKEENIFKNLANSSLNRTKIKKNKIRNRL